jgi:hypothetical protein
VSSVVRVSYVPELPLAMYRELAAHLSQVEGVSTELIWQDSQKFDQKFDQKFNYDASQISGMWLKYTHDFPEYRHELIRLILSHYGTWKAHPDLPISLPTSVSPVGLPAL